MRLASLQEFRRLLFSPDSAPSLETLRVHVRDRKIPGATQLAGRYYIDLDEFDRANSLRSTIAAKRQELAKNPLLDGLL